MNRHALLVAGTLAAVALGAAGCAGDTAATGDTAPATFKLSQGSSAPLAGAAAGILADFIGGDHDGDGRLDLSSVDSVLVTLTRVDVLPDSLIRVCHPPEGDSAHGFHPGRPAMGGPGGMMGPGRPDCGHPRFGEGGGPGGMHFGFGFPRPPMPPDSLRPDSGFGHRMDDWYSLDVTGNTRIDLLHLPTDSANGVTLAAGSLPAGDYGAARLIVSDATIWFNTTITTDGGVTLQPDTPYPVRLPRMADKMGIVTDAGFTIPEGGGAVTLVFDAASTVHGAAVTDSGTVILLPFLRPHRQH